MLGKPFEVGCHLERSRPMAARAVVGSGTLRLYRAAPSFSWKRAPEGYRPVKKGDDLWQPEAAAAMFSGLFAHLKRLDTLRSCYQLSV